MFKFIDRAKELKWLEENYERETSFPVIYGRRRVGKTELIKQFVEEKPHIYFMASEKSERENLTELKDLMASYLEENLFRKTEFDSWEELFSEFMERVDEKIVICIDEFPYLIEVNSAIPSIFQKIWDLNLKDKEVMLILCGSSIGMMESKVLNYRAPLYGRRTGQWKLEPFKFKVMGDFFPSSDFEERLKFYGFLDGIPQYLNKMKRDKTPEWNLKNKFFKKGEYLYEEAPNLLKQELRKPSNYFSILHAISEGNTRYGEICNRTGLEKSMVSQYLKNLRELHIVQKNFPITQKKESRNALYSLTDNYYDFWFEFVYPNRSTIEEDKQEILMRTIRQKLKMHYSFVFETVARQLIHETGRFGKVGAWWYKDNEIDLVALNESGQANEILFGECKWSKNKVGRGVLNNLESTSRKVNWHNQDRKETYALFSKSGFREDLEQLEKEREDLEIYDPDKMDEVFSS